MKKFILKVASFLGRLAALFVFGVVVFCAGMVYQERNPNKTVQDMVPTICEIQQMIGCELIDGKLCKSWWVKDHSETQTKWDRASNQQSCDEAIAGMPKEKSDD